MKDLHVRDLKAVAGTLRAGERIYLSGTVYTARDAAHKRLMALLDAGEALPFPLEGAVIYYAGPTPAPPGMPVGACGPTTSSRMDAFAPRLFDLGMAAAIGKGEMGAAVREAVVRNGAAYLCAVGGAGALIARQITAVEEIAFPDLGCESIKRMAFEKMPLTVAYDCRGGDLFQEGRAQFLRQYA